MARLILTAVIAAVLSVPASAADACHTVACKQRVRAKHEAREIRKVTPYRCARGRYAIPCRILACESYGGRWDAVNGNAVGPYQLLGKGAPWPVRSRRDRLAHHRLAARLWNGGRGAGHWRQCL